MRYIGILLLLHSAIAAVIYFGDSSLNDAIDFVLLAAFQFITIFSLSLLRFIVFQFIFLHSFNIFNLKFMDYDYDCKGKKQQKYSNSISLHTHTHTHTRVSVVTNLESILCCECLLCVFASCERCERRHWSN
jgi:hypothetical protein